MHGKEFRGYLDSALMAIFIVGVVLVVGDAAIRVWKTLHGVPIPEEAFGPAEDPGAFKIRCS